MGYPVWQKGRPPGGITLAPALGRKRVAKHQQSRGTDDQFIDRRKGVVKVKLKVKVKIVGHIEWPVLAPEARES
jgi:hypothetical protein